MFSRSRRADKPESSWCLRWTTRGSAAKAWTLRWFTNKECSIIRMIENVVQLFNVKETDYFIYPLASNHFSTIGASRSTHLANPLTRSRLYEVNLISSKKGRVTWFKPLSNPLTSLFLKKVVMSSAFCLEANFPRDKVINLLRTTMLIEYRWYNKLPLAHHNMRGEILPVIFHGLPP
jgi:hypothetical protein